MISRPNSDDLKPLQVPPSGQRLSPHLVLDNTRTALAFLDNPVTEGWP